MVALPAIALKVPTYATRTPYITVEEYVTSPTGVDISQLIPGGSPAANATALQVVIGRASSWADSLCNMSALAATADTQTSPARGWRIHRDGTVRVPLANAPIVAVTAAGFGVNASSLALLPDLSNVWIGEKVATIPVSGLGAPQYMSSYGNSTYNAGQYVVGYVQYINGWANTLIAGTPAAGVSALTVVDGTGIFPGLRMTIYDAASSEVVTVSPAYVFGSTTVPISMPTVYPHDGNTSISAFPAAIKQAIVSLTSCLIRTRGIDALSMGAFGAEPAVDEVTQSGGFTDLEIATDLLAPFVRII